MMNITKKQTSVPLNQADSLTTPVFDWVDRWVCAYLALPVFLFCFWFVAPLGIFLALLLGYGVISALKPRVGPLRISVAWLVGIFFLAAAWAALGGAGHFFYANLDWVIRDAVLHDLTNSSWPPHYLGPDQVSWLLRAPVGYFLPAAALAKISDEFFADKLLYLWTALGWALVLVSSCRLFDGRIERIVCLLVLSLFGGMDFLHYVWKFNELPPLGAHLEWWTVGIQYSANSTLLFWVPNHALPAWLATAIILYHWRKPTLSRLAPLLATAVPLWSPLAAMGLFPFFVFGMAWRRDFKILFSFRSCLPFVPVGLLIIGYLGLDATAVPHGWRMDVVPFMFVDIFLYWYIFFAVIEFGLLALLLTGLARMNMPLILAILVLLLLPFYYIGPSNDFGMRASIPALMVLALATVKPLSNPSQAFARSRLVSYGLMVLVLLIGALGALQEPARALVKAAWAPGNESVPRAVLSENPGARNFFPVHYFAHTQHDGFQKLLRQTAPLDMTDLEPPQALPGKRP